MDWEKIARRCLRATALLAVCTVVLAIIDSEYAKYTGIALIVSGALVVFSVHKHTVARMDRDETP